MIRKHWKIGITTLIAGVALISCTVAAESHHLSTYGEFMTEDFVNSFKYNEDYTYYINDGGTVTLFDYHGESSNATLPAYIDGVEVTEIHPYLIYKHQSNGGGYLLSESSEYFAMIDGVLYNKIDKAVIGCNTSIYESYTIPEGIVKISDYAFSNCCIPEIVIPDTVNYIGDYAFSDTSHLDDVILPSSIEYIGEGAFSDSYISGIDIPSGVNSIEPYTFQGCYRMSYINIPETVTYIGEYALGGWLNIKSLTLPDSIEYIGEGALENYHSVETLTLPKNLNYLGEAALCGTEELMEIHIYENDNFVYSQGMLIDVANGILLYANPNEIPSTVIVPEGVKVIGTSAFSHCSSVREFILPSTLEAINDYAMQGCIMYGAIEIPDSVTYISETAGISSIVGSETGYAKEYANANGITFAVKDDKSWLTGNESNESEQDTISLNDIATAQNSAYNNYEIGSIISFGKYEQDGIEQNGAEAIEWVVLDKTDNAALLLSRYILDEKSYFQSDILDNYYDEYEGIYGEDAFEDFDLLATYMDERLMWSTSYTHEWLNNEFMNSAFSDDDLNKILKPENETFGTLDTSVIASDTVFLLSQDEMWRYFSTEDELKCGKNISSDYSDYWLRGNHFDMLWSYADMCSRWGEMTTETSQEEEGIRPVIIVKIN